MSVGSRIPSTAKKRNSTVRCRKSKIKVSRTRTKKNRFLKNKKKTPVEDTGKKTFKKWIKLKIFNFLPFLKKESWKSTNFWKSIFVDGTFANKFIKDFGIWLICHLVGLIMFFFCCIKYSTDPRRIAVYVAMATEMTTAVICGFRTIKIIFLVGIPSLLTSRLRTVIVITIITWAFQGPAMNATNNIRSSVEGVACVQIRTRALADEMRTNANSKLQEVPLDEARELIDNVAKPFRIMTQTLRKIENSVSRMMEWQKMVNEMMLEIFEICSEFIRIPYNQCLNKLNDFYYYCTESTYDFVCQPILLLKKQCFAARFVFPVCSWPSKMKKNIEEAVVPYVKNTMNKALDLTKNTTFYKIVAKGKEIAVGTKEAYDTLNITVQHNFSIEQKINVRISEFKAKLRSEVLGFQNFLFIIMWIADLVIYMILLVPFITSVLYVIRFNRMEKVDNYFLTQELKNIEENRKQIKETRLFPLSKEESSTYIWPLSWRISSKEKLKLAIKIAMTVIGMSIPVMFVLVDILTYTVLNTGYEFFHSNYTQIIKPNVYQLKISGTGFLSLLLSNILEVFQPVNSATEKKDSLWRTCFLEPSPPKYRTYRLMCGLFMIAVFTCFVEVYVRRFRHIIASRFFPDRRRPRALFLCTEIKEKRKNFLAESVKMARARLLRNKKEKKEKRSFEVNVQVKTNQCIRCARTDLSLTSNSTTRICVNCRTLYCVDCFSISKRCYDCQWPLQKVFKNTEFYVDSSGSESE